LARELRIPQACVEIAITGLALHHPGAVGVGHIGEGGTNDAPCCLVLAKQGIQQRCKRSDGRGGHFVSPEFAAKRVLACELKYD
jgi:hypothetical protein